MTTEQVESPEAKRTRLLGYRLLGLPYAQRMFIVITFGLVENIDEVEGRVTTSVRWSERAQERGLLLQVEAAIDEWYAALPKRGTQ
jgi:hypothetical protein